MGKITHSFTSPLILITLLVLITFNVVENNPYANYGVSLTLQTTNSYYGPINMGINTV